MDWLNTPTFSYLIISGFALFILIFTFVDWGHGYQVSKGSFPTKTVWACSVAMRLIIAAALLGCVIASIIGYRDLRPKLLAAGFGLIILFAAVALISGIRSDFRQRVRRY